LLTIRDPDPVEMVTGAGNDAVLLVCEHAGQQIPVVLNGLGITQAVLDDHVGWDIGAAKVTRMLAANLGCAAVLQRYSRLVIDCNRPPDVADSIPEISDLREVPSNRGLGPADRATRYEEIFAPYEAALTGALGQPGLRAVLSIHSFTPQLAADPRPRPWDIGFLYRKDEVTSGHLARTLAARFPGVVIGMNEPYRIDDGSDWFVPRHGERTGLAHSLIEIRNDHLRNDAGCRFWADLLADCIRALPGIAVAA
jgi:predicted N-formylglutamate amidohydrolase